jgi:type I restriction enzyme S subunit
MRGNNLPDGWAIGTIPELLSKESLFSDGDWIETKDQDPNGEVRLIQLADIGEGFFKDKSDRFLTTKTAKKLNCTFLKTGDLLIARLPDPLGRCCIFPGDIRPCVTAVDVCIVRVGESSAPHDWLMNVINSIPFRNKIERLSSGTTRKRISRKNLAIIEFPIAPLAEQKRIANKIEALQAKSKKAKKALETAKPLLDKLRQSILASAFRGDLTADWRKKNPDVEPASVLLERIRVERRKKWEETELAKMRTNGKEPKDDKWKAKYKEPESVDNRGLPELPENWCWVKLEEIALLKGGITKGKKRKETDSLKATPYLRVANVQRGYLDLEELSTIDATKTEISDLQLHSGDILFNEGGDRDKLGRGWVWKEEVNICIHQNHVFRPRISVFP